MQMQQVWSTQIMKLWFFIEYSFACAISLPDALHIPADQHTYGVWGPRQSWVFKAVAFRQQDMTTEWELMNDQDVTIDINLSLTLIKIWTQINPSQIVITNNLQLYSSIWIDLLYWWQQWMQAGYGLHSLDFFLAFLLNAHPRSKALNKIVLSAASLQEGDRVSTADFLQQLVYSGLIAAN